MIKKHQDSMLAKYALKRDVLLDRNNELELNRNKLHKEIQSLYVNKITSKIVKGWRFDGTIY